MCVFKGGRLNKPTVSFFLPPTHTYPITVSFFQDTQKCQSKAKNQVKEGVMRSSDSSQLLS